MRKWNPPNLTNFRANLGQMRICINLPVTVNAATASVATLSESIRADDFSRKRIIIFSAFKSYWHMTNFTWWGRGREVACPIPAPTKSLAQAPAPLGQSVTGCHRQMEFCHKCCCSCTEVVLLVVFVATGTSDIFSCKISRSCIFKSAQKRIRAANCCQTLENTL